MDGIPEKADLANETISRYEEPKPENHADVEEKDTMDVLFGGVAKIDTAVWFVTHQQEPANPTSLVDQLSWSITNVHQSLTKLVHAGMLVRQADIPLPFERVPYLPTNSPFWQVIEAIAVIRSGNDGDETELLTNKDLPESPEDYLAYLDEAIKLLFYSPARFYTAVWLLSKPKQDPPYYARLLAREAQLRTSDVHAALTLFTELGMLTRFEDIGQGKRVVRYEPQGSLYWDVFIAGARALTSVAPLSVYAKIGKYSS